MKIFIPMQFVVLDLRSIEAGHCRPLSCRDGSVVNVVYPVGKNSFLSNI